MTSIEPGQIYRSCHPLDEGRRIRVTEAHPDGNATVIDATTGKRPRRILGQHLHASAVTKSGKPRRTGYALDTASPS